MLHKMNSKKILIEPNHCNRLKSYFKTTNSCIRKDYVQTDKKICNLEYTVLNIKETLFGFYELQDVSLNDNIACLLLKFLFEY